MISNLSPGAEAFLANMERVQRKMADAPHEIDSVLQIRTNSLHNAQIQSNLTLAKGDADAADGALSSAIRLLDRARVLGAHAANFTLDAAGRTSIADEV